MPLLLADRAERVSPVPLYTTGEGRMLGIPFTPDRWRRLRRGVHAERQAFDALQPWRRYAARVHAFARKHPDAVLCMESAAVLHGLPSFGETRDIHVYDPERSASWRHGDVRVHTSRDRRLIETIAGVQVTALAETVADLGRVLPPAQALAVVDSAVSPAQGGMLRIEDLRAMGDDQQNRRGRARLRWLWTHADGKAESPGESVSRAVIGWCGLEVPLLQQEFRYEGMCDRADFFFPSCGVIGESDGWQKYALEDRETAARALSDEKRREDRLRRHGHAVARWDLRDAWQVTPLQSALTAAGVPLTRPPQPAMLATLTRRAREKHPAA